MYMRYSPVSLTRVREWYFLRMIDDDDDDDNDDDDDETFLFSEYLS